MDKYSGLAYVYDHIMDHVPYDAWVEGLEKIFADAGSKPVRLLDCACGTGAMSNRLAEKGYVVTGIDLSEDMLVHAQETALDKRLKVRYLLMDMRSILIRDKFDAVISYFDGVNYLMTPEDLEAFFASVAKVLKAGGLFVFDMSTRYKMENTLGQNTFAESHDDMAYIWENDYSAEDHVLKFDMTLFFKEDDESFERQFESHLLKGHSIEEITGALPEAFSLVGCVDGDTYETAKPDSERVLFILKKKASTGGNE